MTLGGIDISNWNAGIDPAAIPGDFVLMRASEGKGMRDEHFAGYDAKVRPSRKLAGAYHFCWVGSGGQVRNTAKAEAANFAAAVESSLRPGFLLVADWEPAGSLSMQTWWAVEFAHEVKRLTGRAPILYANRGTLDRGLWQAWRDEIGTDYWLAGGTAQYAQRVDGYNPGPRGRNPHGFGDPAMWQFTEHGYLPGWGSRLDLNIFYGDADDWRLLADGTATREPPKEQPVTRIPTIRENDPPVVLKNSHGEVLRDSRGNPRKGCVCMAITLPLVEQEMIRAGRIKRSIDVFQAGYNPGGVAASAGTHDMGGVIDVAQGIAREDRVIWADYGWMMAPRTREWGWSGGAHGHGVLHGCVHRSPSAAKQIRDMMAGRNGLKSNMHVGWVKPSRAWQDAFLASAPPLAPAPPRATGEDVPDIHQQAPITINHAGGGWALARPEAFSPYPTPTHYQLTAYVDGSEGTTIKARVAWWRDGWQRGPEVTINPTPGRPTQGQISHAGRTDSPGINVHLDVWADKPDRVTVCSTALVWPV